MKKIFLVGCSRSGTSVIQKSIIERCGLWSMPETGYFLRDLNRVYGRASALSGLYISHKDKVIKNRVDTFFRAFFFVGRVVGFWLVLSSLFSKKSAEKVFDFFFCNLSGGKGYKGWIEKSPLHFQKIEDIEKAMPDAKFVYVIRKGEDVVSSIVDRANKHPELFSHQKEFSYGVNLWNESIVKAISRLGEKNTSFIFYESFVMDPESQIGRCLSELGLKHTKVNGEDIKVVSGFEGWKSGVSGKIEKQEKKIDRIFNSLEKERVVNAINNNGYEYLKLKLA